MNCTKHQGYESLYIFTALEINKYIVQKCMYTVYTGWGKILSLFSVGHCEGRGGRRRVGLGLKGAGSREVPVTTLPSRKDGVVQ